MSTRALGSPRLISVARQGTLTRSHGPGTGNASSRSPNGCARKPDPQRAFGGVGGQGVRFRMTEGLECVAIHALVGNDAAGGRGRFSDSFEDWIRYPWRQTSPTPTSCPAVSSSKA